MLARMTSDAEFAAAYDRVLARWPDPVDVRDVPSAYGRTRITSRGPAGGPPLVLLPGGGATSTVWFANAGALSKERRIHAVDLPHDAGRTVVDGQPVDSIEALHGWLDTVLDEVGSGSTVDLAGHSYGAWVALTYAIGRPDRLRRLALLDPTQCFGGFSPGYLLHALPALVRPGAAATSRLLRWEAGGAPLDPGWLDLVGRSAEVPTGKLVTGRRPATERVRGLDVPTLVLLAGRSRAHSAPRIAARARTLLARGTVEVLPDATHHTLPMSPAGEVDRALLDFLG
jgi:pimeloyl-ACP methyl ester carboxylesterase